MRTARAAVGTLVAVGSLVIGGTSALGAESATPKGGAVRLFLTPKGGENRGGTILITGAIGDHGTYGPSLNAEGKPDPKGTIGKVTLSEGTFEVNLMTLSAKSHKVKPEVNKATCSFSLSVSGPVTLMEGTGLYAGIGGTIEITENYGAIGTRYKSGKHKGKCDTSESAKPVAEAGTIFGSGKVHFSTPEAGGPY